MASIKNTLNISGGVINYLIVVLYKTTAPTVEVNRVVYTSGTSSNPFNYEFTGLQDGTYIVKVHESSNGTTLGAIRHDFWMDATSNKILRERRFFTVDSGVGAAPANGASSYIDTSLAGKTVTGVFREGYRFLIDAVEWQNRSTGGFDLLSGFVFNSSEVWCFEIEYTESIVAPAPDDPFSIVDLITTNATLTTTNYNHTVVVEASGSIQTTTLPVLAGVPDGKGFVIKHGRGSAKNVIVKANGSEQIKFRGASVNKVVLGIGEWIKLSRITVSGSPIWYVVAEQGQWDKVGDPIFSRTDVRDNGVVANGQELDLAVYVRLADYLDSLPSGQVVTYSQFDTTATIDSEVVYPNRGFFARDTVNNKAKVPDLLDKHLRFLKNIGGADTSRTPNTAGGYQHDAIREHSHNALEAMNTSHGSASSNQPGPNVKLLVNTSTGPVATVQSAKVSGVSNSSGTANAGADTHGKNIGFVPIILI